MPLLPQDHEQTVLMLMNVLMIEVAPSRSSASASG